MLSYIYQFVPVFLQNAMLSGYGVYLKKTRTGGIYKATMNALQERRGWTRDDFFEYSAMMFSKILYEACKNVPYYSNRPVYFKYLDGGIPRHDLPVLTKSVIRDNHKAFQSNLKSIRKLKLSTTGTTGSPLIVPCSYESRQMNYAFFDDFLLSVGVNLKSRRAVFGGRNIVGKYEKEKSFWRSSYFQNTKLFSVYHISDENLPLYVKELIKFSPAYIEAYPSALYLIARYMLENDYRLNCDAVITSSETLLPKQRKVIEDAFNCLVFDQYGSVEMSAFVAQCTYGRYHIRPDYGFLEIVDGNGCEVAPGKIGNIVSTGFINRVFPLFRYALGDSARLSSEVSCPCGLNTPIIDDIIGRNDDYIVTARGNTIGRVSTILKGLPVIESQFVQVSRGEILIKVVPDTDEIKILERKIYNKLSSYIDQETILNIKFVDSIEKGPGGKFRPVISLI